MNTLEKNKNLLLLGTKLRMCAEYDSSDRVYEEYIRAAAKLSEREDSLEMIYGYGIYRSLSVNSAADAVRFASIAVCCKELIRLMRSKFPNESAWQSPSKDQHANPDLIAFFEWLGTSRTVSRDHYTVLKNAYRALSESQKICIDTSSAVERCTLMEVVSGLVNRNIRLIDRKLSK